MATAGQRFNTVTMRRNEENTGIGKEIGVVKGRRAMVTRKPLTNLANSQKPAQRNASKQQSSNIQLKKRLLTTTLKNEIAVKQYPIPTIIKPDQENDVPVQKLSKVVPSTVVAAPVLPEPVPMDVSVAKTPKVEQENQLENAFSRMRFDVEDIDSDDRDNPYLVAEYVNDIYAYLKELENEHSLSENFLLNNKQVTGRFRRILVDWLIQIHTRLSLLQETLYLTIIVLDRFLAVDKGISKNELQLTGVTCMLIASKFEEMYLPALKDFVYLGNNSFKERDILLMEMRVLDKLQFNLCHPLPLNFLRRYSKAAGADTTHHTMAKYFMELSLTEHNLAHVKASNLAASALCLAFEANDKNKAAMHESVWNSTAQHYSGYDYSSLLPVMKELASLVIKASASGKTTKVNTVYRKYASSRLLQISMSKEMNGPAMKYFASLK